MGQERLDIAKLQSVEDLEAVNWSQYFCGVHNNGIDGWLKHIKYPVLSEDLNRVCKLAAKCKRIRLSHGMGELFVKHGHIQLELPLS